MRVLISILTMHCSRALARGGSAMLIALALLSFAMERTGSAQAPIDAPPAEDCRIAPRTIKELAMLGSPTMPSAALGMHQVSQNLANEEATLAAGAGFPRLADASTTAEVAAVIREYAACINAGATLRGFSLITDDFARRALFPFGPEEMTEEFTAAVSAVNPLPPDELEGLRGIGPVTLVDESTAHVPVVAEKVSVLEAEPDHKPWLFIMVKVGDRWLIDNYGLPVDVAP